MRAKKLTKREWYQLADFYCETVFPREPVDFGSTWCNAEQAENIFCAEITACERAPLSLLDGWYLRSQYYLEQAGVPAGDK